MQKLKKYKAPKPPKVYDYKGDLSKRWFIEYEVLDHSSETYKKLRSYVPMHAKAAERKKAIGFLLEQINDLLSEGLNNEHTGTFDADELTYLQAWTYFVNYKNGTVEGFGTKKLCVEYNAELAKVRHNTWRNYKEIYGAFGEYLKKQGKAAILLKNITPALARNYATYLKRDRKLSNKRVNMVRDTLSGLYNHFTRMEDMPLKNPFAKVEKLANNSSQKHPPFSDADLKRISDFCEKDESYHQLLLFIRFLYYTLARPYEEIRNLKVKDLAARHILIRAENQKNALNRRIDIPAALEEQIVRYRLRDYPAEHYIFGKCESGLVDGKPATPAIEPRSDTSLYTQHRKVLKALGMEGYTLYGYKHTGAIAFYKATKDIIRVRDMCGHTSVSTTEIYLRDIGAFENEAVEVKAF